MSKIGKIAQRLFKWIIPAILALLIILVLLGGVFQERIISWIIKDFQSELALPVRIEKLSFSLIENFPHASVIVKNGVALYPNKGNTDTLVAFKRLYLNLNIIELIKGNLSIGSVELNNTNVFLNTLSNGQLPRIQLFKKNTSNSSTALKIRSIEINYLAVNYTNNRNKTNQNLSLQYCKFSGEISETGFIGHINARIEEYKTSDNSNLVFLGKDAKIDITGEYISNKKIAINRFEYYSKYISIRGEYNSRVNHLLNGNFHFVATTSKPEIFKMLLPSATGISISGLNSASFELTGKTIGPGVMDIAFTALAEVNKMKLTIRDVKIDNITARSQFRGAIRNNIIQPNEITIDPSKISIQDKEIRVSLHYKPHQHILVAKVDGDIAPEIFAKIFKISSPIISGENIQLNATLSSTDFSLTNFDPLGLNIQGNVNLLNMNLTLPKIKFTGISGEVGISDALEFKHLSLGGSLGSLDLSGTIPHWRQSLFLAKSRIPLEIAGNLSSPYLNLNLPEWGISDKTETADKEKDTTETPLIISKVEVNFYAQKIAIRQLKGNKAQGTLVYIPNQSLSLKKVSLETFGGKAIFSLTNQQVEKENTLSLTGKIAGINIDSLFKTFNNFDLTIIDYKNISGKVSADIDLKGVYEEDNLLNNKLSCVASIDIADGCIKNYEPLKKLSGFVNLKELERINFKQLKNTVQIKNGEIVIPEMFVENNALNISLSGIHKLSGSFDYRMKVRLKDLLWAKKKSHNQFRSELGIVEQEEPDGGSIFIKVIGTPENYSFSYDKSRAIETIGNRLKQEGVVLRNIFKKEKELAQKPPEVKRNSGFIISDSLGTKRNESKADTTKLTPLKKNSGFKIEWE